MTAPLLSHEDRKVRPAIKVWLVWLALSNFVLAVTSFSPERFYRSTAYEWVTSLAPIGVWAGVFGVLSLGAAVAFRRGNVHLIRTVFAVHALVMSLWAISIAVLVVDGSLTAITAVVVWTGNVLGSIKGLVEPIRRIKLGGKVS